MPESKDSPYALRTIRIRKEDLEALDRYFKNDNRTLTAGIRLVLEDFIKKNSLRDNDEENLK